MLENQGSEIVLVPGIGQMQHVGDTEWIDRRHGTVREQEVQIGLNDSSNLDARTAIHVGLESRRSFLVVCGVGEGRTTRP